MVRRNKLVFVLVVVAALSAFYIFWQSDEAQIRKQLNSLVELISKDGGESPIIFAQKTRKAGLLFAERCSYEATNKGYSGKYTRQQIGSQAAAVRSQFSNLTLKLYDVSIDVFETKKAVAILTASLKGKTKSSNIVDDAHEIEMIFSKIEGDWLISHIKIVEVLER